MSDSLSHARRAKISVAEFMRRVQKSDAYEWRKAPLGKALLALEAEAKIGAGGSGVVPMPSAPVHPADSLIFCAQDPARMLTAPLKYAAVLSADRAYRAATLAAIPRLKAQGRRVYSWSDCRPAPGGTPATEAIYLAAAYQLDGWIGQGESAAEVGHAVAAATSTGEPFIAIVGNLSAIRADQKELIRLGKIIWLQEVYFNEDSSLVPDFENLPVRVCDGLYPGAAGYVPLSWYRAAGWFPPGSSVYLAEGVSAQDWGEL